MKRDTRKFVRRMKSQRLAKEAIATSAATTRPARTPGVSSALMTSRTAPTKTIVRHASPNSNLRLKSMLLHAPVERSAAETELGGRGRNVEMVHPERPLDHLPFELVEVERFSRPRGDRRSMGASRKREIVCPILVALSHDHRTLRGVPKCPHIARPVVLDQRRQHRWRKIAPWLVILVLVEPQIMVEEQRDIVAPLAKRRQLDLDRVEPE